MIHPAAETRFLRRSLVALRHRIVAATTEQRHGSQRYETERGPGESTRKQLRMRACRTNRTQEVVSSILISSTNIFAPRRRENDPEIKRQKAEMLPAFSVFPHSHR